MKRILSHPILLLFFITAGVLWGMFLPQVNPRLLLPFADLYFNVINLVVVPLIITSIVASVGILIRQKVVGKVFIRFIVCVFIFFSVIVFAILMFRAGFHNLITADQGENRIALLSFDQSVQQFSLDEDAGESNPQNLVGRVQDIVPRNIFTSLVNNNLLSIIFFSVVLGCVLGLFRKDISTSLITLFDSLYLAFQKIFQMAILFLPFGILPVVANFVRSAVGGYDAFALSRSFLIMYGGVFVISMMFSLGVAFSSKKWSFSQIFNYFLRITILSFTGNPSIIILPVILHMHDQQSEGHSIQIRSLASLSLVILNIGAIAFFFTASLFGTDVTGTVMRFSDYMVNLGNAFYYSIFSNASSFNNISASMSNAIGAPLLHGFFQALLPFLFPIIALFSSIGSVLVLSVSSWGRGAVVTDPEKEFFLEPSDTVMEPIDGEKVKLAQEKEVLVKPDRIAKTTTGVPLSRIFTIPLRLSLGLLVTVMLILYASISGILQFEGARLSAYQVVYSLIEEIISRSDEAVSNYLKSVEGKADSLSYVINKEIIPWREDRQVAMRYFRDGVMGSQENITAVYWGDSAGNFYMQRRMKDGSFSTRTVLPSEDERSLENIWTHENPELYDTFPSIITDIDDTNNFDPRRRPWYQRAVKGDKEGTWTDVYVFFSERTLGLTYSFPVYEEDGSVSEVFGIDVTIEDISIYLSQLHVANLDQGYAFLFDAYSRNLIAVSFPDEKGSFSTQLYEENPVTEAFDPERIKIENAPEEIVHRGYQSYLEEMESGKSSISKWWSNFFFSISLESEHLDAGLLSVVKFSYEDESYLFSLAEFQEFPWIMGIILPEDLFLQYVYRNNEVQIVLLLFIFVLVGIISSIFAGKISKSLGALSEDMERVKKLELIPIPSSSFIREVHHMGGVLDNMKQGLDAFKRYIPSDVVLSLLEMGDRVEIGGRREEVTIFFSDIENFTRKSEINSPEAILSELKSYFDIVSNIVSHHKGTIDKYIGDAVMAFWGAPREVKDHAVQACMAAFLCQQSLKNQSIGSFYTHTRIGLHTGRVLVGNVGSENRINYTILGDAVNLASRLEGLNKRYGTSIILSQETHARVAAHFETRFLDQVVVKGKEKSTTIYELVGLKGGDEFLLKGDTNTVRRFLMLYNEGVRYYREREWAKAASFFAKAYRLIPDDRPVKLLYARSYHFYKNPPPQEWTGFVKV